MSSSNENQNDTSSDEAVSQFLAITGSSDANQAQSYLEMSANDLQNAITLFFEHQSGAGGGMGGGLGGGIGAGSAGAGMGTNSGFDTGASGSNSMNHNAASGASSMGGADLGFASGLGGMDDVRAPDQTRNMRLMDFDGPTGALMSGVGGGNDMAGLMNHPVLGAHMEAMMNINGAGNGGNNADNLQGMSAFADDADVGMGMGMGVGMNRMRSGGGNNGITGMDDPQMISNVRDMINASANNTNDITNINMGNDPEVQITGTANGSSASTTTGTGAGIGTMGNYNNQAQKLSEMFAAPTHLMHIGGGFQGARNVAKDSRRWLLVNLQSDEDFACHALNRDVWRDELVENLVREGFVFWQSVNTSQDGRTYAQRYGVHSFPHIAIIDPRTARLMYQKDGWTQENPMTAEKFAELAVDFCSRNSFDKPPSIPKDRNSGMTNSTAAIGSSSTAASSSQNSNSKPAAPAAVERMTEEEQLQAAIRASMNDVSGVNNGKTDSFDDDDDDMQCDNSDDEVYVMDDDSDDDNDNDNNDNNLNDNNDEQMEEVVEVVEPVKEVTFHDEILAMNVGEEPSGTDGVARIMIRMPDGKRLVRKFKVDDAVKMVYAFVSQSSDDSKGGKEFELKAGFPPKNLLPIVDNTIQSSGLAGDSVTVRWKED